jgi:6-pyruvoyltetrahydropterin/6-carboxytetrahydropterin synthase
LLKERDSGRSCCWEVEALENSRNAAHVHSVPPWFVEVR